MTPLLVGLESLAISHVTARNRAGFIAWLEIMKVRNLNIAKAISETYSIATVTCQGNPVMESVSELKSYVARQGITHQEIEGAIRYNQGARAKYLALLHLLWKDNE